MAGGSVTELAAKLYDACLGKFPSDHLFYQQDLLGLSIVPKNDLALLLQCTQSLVDQKLFRLLHGKNDRLAWKIISREDADKYGYLRFNVLFYIWCVLIGIPSIQTAEPQSRRKLGI